MFALIGLFQTIMTAATTFFPALRNVNAVVDMAMTLLPSEVYLLLVVSEGLVVTMAILKYIWIGGATD